MRLPFLTLVGVFVLDIPIAAAATAWLHVCGSPAGYQCFPPDFSQGPYINNNGLAVGESASGVLRWNASGGAVLGNLGSDPWYADAFAINDNGFAVGMAFKYVGGSSKGTRAVRWIPGESAAVELGTLATNTTGYGGAVARAINATGTAVGQSTKFSSGQAVGDFAVYWDAAGTAAVELPSNIGPSPLGRAQATAFAINDTGIIVGRLEKYDSSGKSLGMRAVRWDTLGATVTELGNLGTDASGCTRSEAHRINQSGTIIGDAERFDASGKSLGHRAVRWDVGTTDATELGNLGTHTSGATGTKALAINAAGTIVGYAIKYDALGNNLGIRAVRWDSTGSAITELNNLGLDASGYTETYARAINAAGTVVGSAQLPGTDASHAVYWGGDGRAVDLNGLIDPASGWTLNFAYGISDTGWITGLGKYDPDGSGPQAAYNRLYIMHVPATVPEPSTLALLGIGAIGLFGWAWRTLAGVQQQ